MQVLMRPWGHMHYRVTGRGDGLPILFLNSLGTDLRMWDAVAHRLHGGPVIGLDKRGHGLSSTPLAPWTIEDLAEDALALLDHLGIARALVAGCSIGGMIAQALAARAPGRCAGLVLSNTAAKIGTGESWAARIAAIRQGGIGSIAGAILERWFAPDFLARPEAGAWATMLVRNDVPGYIGTCEALAAADLRGSTPLLRLPVLCLAGSADLSTPPEMVRALAASIPGARVEVLDGSGHLPAIDAPDAVAALIQSFRETLA